MDGVVDLSCDGSLNIIFKESRLEQLWVKVFFSDHKKVSKKMLNHLVPLCDTFVKKRCPHTVT